MFELAFHLPFYAWRRTPSKRARDVSFLAWDIGQRTYFLHRAKFSCVVAGTDEWRWVASCFVDTAFDADSDERETVRGHYEDSQGEGSLPINSYAFGRTPLEP